MVASDHAMQLDRPNYQRARGLQRLWIHVLIWWHEYGVHNDTFILQRYKGDPSETEFCTATLMHRATEIANINRLRMRL